MVNLPDIQVGAARTRPAYKSTAKPETRSERLLESIGANEKLFVVRLEIPSFAIVYLNLRMDIPEGDHESPGNALTAYGPLVAGQLYGKDENIDVTGGVWISVL